MPLRVNRALGVCGFVVLALSLALSLPGRVAADPPHVTDVRVVNTPLPVTTTGVTQVGGSVEITGTPTINARQTGPWAVTVTSLPNVGIDPAQNTVQLPYDASNPLPVRDANNDREPWSFFSDVTFALNVAGTFCDTPEYQVPQGKRLVVTQIGIEGGSLSGRALTAFIFSNGQRNVIPAQLIDNTAGFASFALTQTLEMYLEPVQSFWCGAARIGGANATVVKLNFSGYLVTKG